MDLNNVGAAVFVSKQPRLLQNMHYTVLDQKLSSQDANGVCKSNATCVLLERVLPRLSPVAFMLVLVLRYSVTNRFRWANPESSFKFSFLKV